MRVSGNGHHVELAVRAGQAQALGLLEEHGGQLVTHILLVHGHGADPIRVPPPGLPQGLEVEAHEGDGGHVPGGCQIQEPWALGLEIRDEGPPDGIGTLGGLLDLMGGEKLIGTGEAPA